MSKKLEIICVIVLLAFFLGINLYLAATDSQTIDEGVHISAGYSYWLTGDFRINPEHPPLFKLLSAVPLLFYGLDLPINDQSWANYNEWDFGRQFLYHNTKPADSIIFLARLFPIILGIILGYYIYKWVKELLGRPWPGIFALFLFALSPNFLAHSHLVTTDVPLTLFFFLSIYYFGHYIKKPNGKNLFLAAFSFALAMLVKYSAAILIPILLILYIFYRFFGRPANQLSFKKIFKVILVYFLVTACLTLIFYAFEFKKPLDDPRVVRLYQEREEVIKDGAEKDQPFFTRPLIKYGGPDQPIGKILYRFAEKIPVPAYTYWRGLFSVLSHNAFGHGSFLLGKASNQGWWYYFIVAFLVKTPLPTLILFFIGIFLILFYLIKKIWRLKSFRKTFEGIPFDYFVISVPPFIYFFWSLTSHINLGVRHIFPIYPFVFMISAWTFNYIFKKSRINIIYVFIPVIVGTTYLLICFYNFPYYLSYFNEAVGGSSNGHNILSDSNLDWSQDVKRLKYFLEKNKIDNFYSYIFRSLVTHYYLKGELRMPNNQEIEESGIKKGYYVISANVLFDPTLNYNWLKYYTPIARIGYSIYVYKF
ncbi:MAG: glycosyltransferase family 39 protein [Patescibacteria group bacterium]